MMEAMSNSGSNTSTFHSCTVERLVRDDTDAYLFVAVTYLEQACSTVGKCAAFCAGGFQFVSQ